jgi:hypothetical protein
MTPPFDQLIQFTDRRGNFVDVEHGRRVFNQLYLPGGSIAEPGLRFSQGPTVYEVVSVQVASTYFRELVKCDLQVVSP